MTNQIPWILYNEPPGNDNEWGCTSTANNKSWFSGGKDDKRILDKVNKDNTMPKDGWLQQYNDSTPQTRGTRRRKMRDEEKRNARKLHIYI